MADRPREIIIPPGSWKRIRMAALELGISASEFVRRGALRDLHAFERGTYPTQPAANDFDAAESV